MAQSSSLGMYVLGTMLLGGTGGVIAYGSFVSLNLPRQEAAASQEAANKQYALQYADGQKALFKTPDGLRLVMVGSSLPSAGRVQSIERRDDRWVVTTSRNLAFAKN
jgi:hypothetical protein